MLFMLDKQSLTVLDMEYDSLTHIMKIFILWNGIEHVISTELIQYISGNGRIRAFGSDEFSSFIMNFMNIEDRTKKIKNLYKIIWDYAENKDSVKFPVRII